MRLPRQEPLDWYIVGERALVVVCAGIALLYAVGVIR